MSAKEEAVERTNQRTTRNNLHTVLYKLHEYGTTESGPYVLGPNDDQPSLSLSLLALAALSGDCFPLYPRLDWWVGSQGCAGWRWVLSPVLSEVDVGKSACVVCGCV